MIVINNKYLLCSDFNKSNDLLDYVIAKKTPNKKQSKLQTAYPDRK